MYVCKSSRERNSQAWATLKPGLLPDLPAAAGPKHLAQPALPILGAEQGSGQEVEQLGIKQATLQSWPKINLFFKTSTKIQNIFQKANKIIFLFLSSELRAPEVGPFLLVRDMVHPGQESCGPNLQQVHEAEGAQSLPDLRAFSLSPASRTQQPLSPWQPSSQ